MSEQEPSICDQETYDQIFRNHYDTVTRYLYYKCGNLQQAEDIVQNVFVKLWELCASVSFSKVKAYIYRAANNTFLNEKAHEKVVLKHLRTKETETDNSTPEYLLEMEEFRGKLKEAIANLPEKQREVYLLSRMEKKSYLEISQIAGIGVKGVERRISKALLQLREVLGNDLKF